MCWGWPLRLPAHPAEGPHPSAGEPMALLRDAPVPDGCPTGRAISSCPTHPRCPCGARRHPSVMPCPSSPPGFRGRCLSPATPSHRSPPSLGTAAPSTTGSCRSPSALPPPTPLRDSSRSTTTRSMSTLAPACLPPPGTASSPPWASSRSPGTTASTQVGGKWVGL